MSARFKSFFTSCVASCSCALGFGFSGAAAGGGFGAAAGFGGGGGGAGAGVGAGAGFGFAAHRVTKTSLFALSDAQLDAASTRPSCRASSASSGAAAGCFFANLAQNFVKASSSGASVLAFIVKAGSSMWR